MQMHSYSSYSTKINYVPFIYCRPCLAAAVITIVAMISISEAQRTCGSENDLVFNFTCPHGQALYYVQGQLKTYVNEKYRIFCFACQSHKNVKVSECYDTGYINKLDRPVVMLCKPDHYLVGVTIDYNNYHHDGSYYGFRCCRNAFQYTRNCHLQGPVNQFNKLLKYKVWGTVIVGALSWYSTRYE